MIKPKRFGGKDRKAQESLRKKRYDRTRGNSGERGYTGAWAKVARAYRAANPVCVHCAAKGRVSPAQEVDHIEPHRGNSILFWDESNWQSLCKPCHSGKTATETRFAGHN